MGPIEYSYDELAMIKEIEAGFRIDNNGSKISWNVLYGEGRLQSILWDWWRLYLASTDSTAHRGSVR